MIFYLPVRQGRLRKSNFSDLGAARGGVSNKEAQFGGELDTRRSEELDSRAKVELPARIAAVEVD